MAVRTEHVSGFILAGGESSRMGHDKALLELGGVPLILRAARLLDAVIGSATVIGRAADAANYEAQGLRSFADDFPGAGPLGGISTALRHSSNPWSLVIGCDLPYLTAEWLAYLLDRALASRADVLLPQSESGLEPLCAMYHQRCEPVISGALAGGKRKITTSLAGLQVEIITPADWKGFDSNGRLFKNMNTPADYAEAQAYFAELEP